MNKCKHHTLNKSNTNINKRNKRGFKLYIYEINKYKTNAGP